MLLSLISLAHSLVDNKPSVNSVEPTVGDIYHVDEWNSQRLVLLQLPRRMGLFESC
jgi:hypothetical protein